MVVRAEMGRIPRDRVRERRRALPAVAQRASPLSRYFPELRFPPGEYVLDGELVILGDGRPAGVRRAPAADPPRRVADPPAGRGDAGPVRRLRPARATTARCCSTSRSRARRKRLEGRRDKPLDLTPCDARARGGGAVAPGRGGRDRQGARCPLPAGRAHRDGEGQARAHDRRVIVGWRPGKEEGTLGSLILGLYDDDGELQVVGHTLGLPREAEARAARVPRALRDRRARQRRPEPLGLGPRAGVDHRAARAGRRGELRPRQRPPHPPRRQVQALARGQGAARVHRSSNWRRSQSSSPPGAGSRPSPSTRPCASRGRPRRGSRPCRPSAPRAASAPRRCRRGAWCCVCVAVAVHSCTTRPSRTYSRRVSKRMSGQVPKIDSR